MSEVGPTHRRRPHDDRASVCGEEDVGVRFSDEPTCLWCITGKWPHAHSEIEWILTRNSVKDLLKAIDDQILASVDDRLKKQEQT